MTNRQPGKRIIETPEERAAYDAQRIQELREELQEEARAQKEREEQLPLVKEATAKMEWLVDTGCGASDGAAAVLRLCYRGGSSHTLKYDDLARFDRKNTELALLLLNTVARQGYTLPEEYLGATGRELFELRAYQEPLPT